MAERTGKKVKTQKQASTKKGKTMSDELITPDNLSVAVSETEQASPVSDQKDGAAGKTKSVWLDDVCNVCYMHEKCRESGEPDVMADCPRHVFRNRTPLQKYHPMPIISISDLRKDVEAAYEIAKRPADAVKDVKLYSAYIVDEVFAGKKDVRMNLFYLNRAEPIGLYDELIHGFYALDEETQKEYSRLVDEFFTAEEIVELYKHLHPIMNVSFVYEEVSLPIGKDENDFTLEHRTNRRSGTLKGSCRPFKNFSWKLSVPVWASFDLTRNEASEEAADKAHEMGRYFLQKYMTANNMDPSSTDEVIEAKIPGLYDIYRHYRHRAEVLFSEISLQQMACTFTPTIWHHF